MCVVCLNNPINSVFMDCGHSGVCYPCALNIFKDKRECHFCRKVYIIIYSII